jgi:hypothetical protein
MRFHLKRSPKRSSRPTLDDADAGWITAGRRPFADYSVGALVPVVFERYARILHPARTRSDGAVRWDAVAAWSGRTMHALAQWDPLSRPLHGTNGPPPFFEPPGTGGLPPERLATLCRVLAVHTSTPERCFAGMWEGYGSLDQVDASVPELRLDQRTFLVYEGPIETVGWIGRPDPAGASFRESPSLIWPVDRAWFVAGDVDLDSTYVGGRAALIAALIAAPGLEAWPISPTDRVTFDSDEINGV